MPVGFLRATTLTCVALRILFPQAPISTRAGLIYYAEGDVSLDDRLLLSFNPMVRVAAGETLRTDAGRAEILLQPQNFLRLADHSSVVMEADALSHVELVITGSAILDVGIVNAKQAVTASCGNAVAEVLRPGIYRLDCHRSGKPDSLTVGHGRASVTISSCKIDLSSNQQALLAPAARARNLHGRHPDEFDDWSTTRTALIASKQGSKKSLEVYKSPAGVIVSGDDRIPPN